MNRQVPDLPTPLEVRCQGELFTLVQSWAADGLSRDEIERVFKRTMWVLSESERISRMPREP